MSKQVEQKTSNLHLYSLIYDSSVVQDAWQWNVVQMTRYATMHAIPTVTLVVSNVFFFVILIISSPAFGFQSILIILLCFNLQNLNIWQPLQLICFYYLRSRFWRITNQVVISHRSIVTKFFVAMLASALLWLAPCGYIVTFVDLTQISLVC